ncbi:MAG TPA: hypothetical protein VNH44_11195 [Micropepsaceae bacterium]|nr:hypothetical protein [Micropepsaceae bacterium]
MATELTPTNQLPLRGVIAPIFMAMALAALTINLWMELPLLFWLGLGSLLMGWAFARYTSRLLANTFPHNE